MSIGKRRERVQISRKVRTQQPSGSYETVPTVIATRFASVTPVRGSEAEQSGRQAGATTYMLNFDSRGTDVTPDDTLVWVTGGNLQLNVREVRRPSGRALALEVVAESGVVIGG